ncbi:hypothetical protein D3C78_1190340 [compost metagenome]
MTDRPDVGYASAWVTPHPWAGQFLEEGALQRCLPACLIRQLPDAITLARLAACDSLEQGTQSFTRAIRCIDQALPEQTMQVVTLPVQCGSAGQQFGGIREVGHGALHLVFP